MGRLDGKVALISGAARGMGLAEARMFAREGAKVVLGDVVDSEGEQAAKEIGESARYLHLDVPYLDPGEYQGRLVLKTAGRTDAVTTQAFTVRER